jgi:F0F1-type ATP synthase delta subunit
MNEVNSLLNSLISVGDRDLLIGEIEIVKRSIFSVGSSDELEMSLKKSLADKRAREFFGYLSKNKKSIYDGHIVEEILEALRQKVGELEVVTVHIPINISDSEMLEMHEKLVRLLGKRILIKTVKDSKLLGGLRLEYNGVYLDLSLATTINKMISKI